MGKISRLARLPLLVLTAACAAAIDCNQLPPPDPGKNFFANFTNECYVINLSSGAAPVFAGDTNALYSTLYYRIDPRYELVFLGSYPYARFMSVAVYDDHEATIGWLRDSQIEPLSAVYVNPFRPGVPFRDNQRYAVVVGMGGAQPPPEAITPGCGFGGLNVHVNYLDASMRHAGLSWDGDPLIPAWFPDHEEGANTAGAILFRRYLNMPSATAMEKPVAFLRDLSNGCAVPSTQALALGVVTATRSTYVTWVHREQEDAHWYYVNQVLPRLCYARDTTNMLLWLRGAEYLPGSNPDAAYLSAQFKISGPKPWFMRIRTRLPAMPAIPCAGCSLTGAEQMRYWSLSFQNKNHTLASISDRDLVKDAEGYVTLIVGLGAQPPEWVTPANGYTYFDLSQMPDYTLISALNVRSILAAPDFECSAHRLNYRTSEYDSLGGLMGEYAPTVDFLLPEQIPLQAEPLREANACGIVPPEQPVPCTTFYQPPAP